MEPSTSPVTQPPSRPRAIDRLADLHGPYAARVPAVEEVVAHG